MFISIFWLFMFLTTTATFIFATMAYFDNRQETFQYFAFLTIINYITFINIGG